MGSIRNKTPLAFERQVEPIQKTVESSCESAQFVTRILYGQPIVQRRFADAVSVRGHVHDGREILACEEIASSRRKNDRDRHKPPERNA